MSEWLTFSTAISDDDVKLLADYMGKNLELRRAAKRALEMLDEWEEVFVMEGEELKVIENLRAALEKAK